MEWNAIYELIDPKLLIVLALCWVVGYIIKQTPSFPNWLIVYVVTVVALIFTVWIMGWSAASIVQGVLVGAFSVYGNELIKQSKKVATAEDKDK